MANATLEFAFSIVGLIFWSLQLAPQGIYLMTLLIDVWGKLLTSKALVTFYSLEKLAIEKH